MYLLKTCRLEFYICVRRAWIGKYKSHEIKRTLIYTFGFWLFTFSKLTWLQEKKKQQFNFDLVLLLILSAI